MNNKGQTLIIFVILVPIIITMMALVVDVGMLENKVLKTKNIVDVAIKEYFNKEDVTVISKTLEENDISTDKLIIKRTDNEVGVNVEYEMSSLFGKIVGLQKYDVKVKRKGIKENEKIKITELNNKLWIYENIKVNFSTRQVLWNDNEVSLGKTRLEILKLLINNKGIVLSREQIINYIWGTHCKINDRTVDSHISKIRTALDLNCLKSIPGYGYILDC